MSAYLRRPGTSKCPAIWYDIWALCRNLGDQFLCRQRSGEVHVSWGALAAVILWGASFVASKIALSKLSPIHLTSLRTTLAALTLDFLLWRQAGWSAVTRLARRDWVRVGTIVPVSVFLHQLVQMAWKRWSSATRLPLVPVAAGMITTRSSRSVGHGAQWRVRRSRPG